jgi:hypothetical protein
VRELEETIRGLVELIKTGVEEVQGRIGTSTQPLGNEQSIGVGLFGEGITQLKRCCRAIIVEFLDANIAV